MSPRCGGRGPSGLTRGTAPGSPRRGAPACPSTGRPSAGPPHDPLLWLGRSPELPPLAVRGQAGCNPNSPSLTPKTQFSGQASGVSRSGWPCTAATGPPHGRTGPGLAPLGARGASGGPWGEQRHGSRVCVGKGPLNNGGGRSVAHRALPNLPGSSFQSGVASYSRRGENLELFGVG